MSCAQSRRLFDAYWDDEITQAEREWLESHFASCESCRAEYESFARVLEWVASLPRTEVAPGLADRALARARRAAPAPDRMPDRPRVWIPVTATAALVGIVAAALMQWTGPTTSSRRLAERTAAPAIEQPTLIAGGTATQPGQTPAEQPASEVVAAIPDSLFNHGEDVEFILDPVTLRKGRAHTVQSIATPEVRGETAVITF